MTLKTERISRFLKKVFLRNKIDPFNV